VDVARALAMGQIKNAADVTAVLVPHILSENTNAHRR
jgi:hypothetical protein